jgi:hypothetical protein
MTKNGFSCLELLQNISSALSERMTAYEIYFLMVVFCVVTSCGYCSNILVYHALSLFKVEMWRAINPLFVWTDSSEHQNWARQKRRLEKGAKGFPYIDNRFSPCNSSSALMMEAIYSSKTPIPPTRQYTEPEHNNRLENFHNSKSLRYYSSTGWARLN